MNKQRLLQIENNNLKVKMAQAEKPEPTIEESYTQIRAADFYQMRVRHEQSKRLYDSAHTMMTNGVCPCGKHKGVTLLRNGVVVEIGGQAARGICPISWWLAKYQIILTENDGATANKWAEEHPLAEVLERFKLEE